MRTQLLTLLASLVITGGTLAQSTAFTYQGEVIESGVRATGTFDMRFRVFDAAVGGTAIGSISCVDNVTVVDGKFTALVDTEQQFAQQGTRFIEVQVRQDTGLTCSNTTGYTTLLPRQSLTSTPRAMTASLAHALSAPDGTPQQAVFVDNTGKVGVGTLTPTHSIHVATAIPTIALQDTSAASQQAGYISYRDNANVERAWVGYGTVGSPHFSIFNQRLGGKIEIRTVGGAVGIPTDNLGIGTLSPAFPLHIAKFGGIPAGGPVIQLQDTGANSTQSGYLGFLNGSGAETGWIGYGTPGSPHMTMINARAGGDIFITPAAGRAVKVPVLEITGADLAEKFPSSEKLEPGMVTAIDPNNPGKLCVARGEYNRCVAGVVSGAKNFSVGAVLGNLPGNEDAPAIALSGRVYVWCDASTAAIRPGDLLTTSNTPGHAMKANDRDRSHGAVIGKAMEPLDSGQGLVLVLVNLQ
jgi:hypothetical protein